MEIDKEGLKKVVERFLGRQEIAKLGLSAEEVEIALLEHAKKWSGCVNCIYSAPYHGKLSWTTRGCVLGLSQNGCEARKPIVQ